MVGKTCIACDDTHTHTHKTKVSSQEISDAFGAFLSTWHCAQEK